jgi:hypothetical protein
MHETHFVVGRTGDPPAQPTHMSYMHVRCAENRRTWVYICIWAVGGTTWARTFYLGAIDDCDDTEGSRSPSLGLMWARFYKERQLC